jgi:hypothetical protein
VESNWKVRIILAAGSGDVNTVNKQTLGAIFANNGSGQSQTDEAKLFDSAVRLSANGQAPAEKFVIETALLFPDMRTAMLSFLNTLTETDYLVTANIELPQYFAGELIQDTLGLAGTPPWDTIPFTMQDMIDILIGQGLQVIL